MTAKKPLFKVVAVLIFVISFVMVMILLPVVAHGADRGSEAKAGTVTVTVTIRTQTATIRLPNGNRYRTKVSTGKKGYRTPRGRYKVYRRHRMWYSRKYDNAPMAYSLFWKGGFASHSGHVNKPFASHGCIRMPHEIAKRLFRDAKGHTVVFEIK